MTLWLPRYELVAKARNQDAKQLCVLRREVNVYEDSNWHVQLHFCAAEDVDDSYRDAPDRPKRRTSVNSHRVLDEAPNLPS